MHPLGYNSEMTDTPLADLMEKMVEAGAPVQAVLIAVRALECGLSDSVRGQSADMIADAQQRRREKDRLRKSLSRSGPKRINADTNADVADSGADIPADSVESAVYTVLSSLPTEEVLKEENTGNARAKQKRGTRISDDFVPNETCAAIARGFGYSQSEYQTAIDEFLDYWRGIPAGRGVKLDWQATFRNRLRQLGPPRRGHGNGHKLGSIRDGFEKVDAVIAEYTRRENESGIRDDEADDEGLSGLRQVTG